MYLQSVSTHGPVLLAVPSVWFDLHAGGWASAIIPCETAAHMLISDVEKSAVCIRNEDKTATCLSSLE